MLALRPTPWCAVWLVVLAVGCQAPAGSRAPGGFAFRTERKAEHDIVTPAMRIESLAALGHQAARMDLATRQQHATQLAAEYQQESDPLVRMQMIRTLGAFNTAEATEVLNSALRDGDSDVRIVVCDAWTRRGDSEAVRTLCDVLATDSDPDVRMAAARCLSKFKAMPEQTAERDRIVAALGAALEDRDPAMQYRAVESLRQVTGRDFGDDVNAWREFVQGGSPPEESFVSRIRRNFF